MNAHTYAALNALFSEAVGAARIPGAVVLVGRGDEINFLKSYGWAQVTPEREAMTPDTWFDIASLTKLAGPWPGIMRRIASGQMALDQTLPELLPRPMHDGLRAVTLLHLLTHTAGLVEKQYLDSFGADRRARIDGLFSMAPAHPIGGQVLYSDLSFIFLGEILAEASGCPLDVAATRLWERLGMRATAYNPPHGAYCAATEIKRGQLRRGRVHDEVATQLMGVSGHAGVFSTARDLAKFCAALLPPAPSPLFDRAWLKRAFTNQTAHLGSNRALGWIVYRERPEGGIVGHTGFTGTSIWMDTASGEYVIILTNRVHPSRENHALGDIRAEAFKIAFGP